MDHADKYSNLFILIQVVRLTSAELMITIPNREVAIFLPNTEVTLVLLWQKHALGKNKEGITNLKIFL